MVSKHAAAKVLGTVKELALIVTGAMLINIVRQTKKLLVKKSLAFQQGILNFP